MFAWGNTFELETKNMSAPVGTPVIVASPAVMAPVAVAAPMCAFPQPPSKRIYCAPAAFVGSGPLPLLSAYGMSTPANY